MWKMRIIGRSNIKRGTAYVMVANHSSGTDIQLLFRLFRPFKWVAKKSLFATPFIGWNMWLNSYIPIERERGRSKLLMMDKAAAAVSSGNSVIIFPEGTRTRDGKIQQFKSGAFRLALETRAPILPIAITGTFQAIQKGGLTIHKSRNIKGYVLEPLPYEQFKDMDPREIAHLVQEIIRKKIEDQTRL
jgi:1-acyl-sn-glycerol-3-phosphate acyltransferase